MAEEQSSQERIAAARQLYAVLKEYLERPTWTPVEGALILSGIHAPTGCVEIPIGGDGLDGKLFQTAANDRFHSAFRIMDEWQLRCEDDHENGETTPAEFSPHEFIAWCLDANIETDWMRFFFEVADGGSRLDRVDLIPPAVVEFAARAAETIGAIQAALTDGPPGSPSATAPVPTGVEPASRRGPIPIPENREYVSTEELAAILAVEPQTIRKRYSETGTYHGIRPTKLPSRRLLWPVDSVKRLIKAEPADE